MRPVREFKEYIKNNIVKRQNPDKSRALFLIKESERSYLLLIDILKKLGLNDENSNLFVKSCYDLIMELIRAKMLIDGYNSSGFKSHESEVSYLRNLGFSENEVQFADQLRFFRNGTMYYLTISTFFMP